MHSASAVGLSGVRRLRVAGDVGCSEECLGASCDSESAAKYRHGAGCVGGTPRSDCGCMQVSAVWDWASSECRAVVQGYGHGAAVACKDAVVVGPLTQSFDREEAD